MDGSWFCYRGDCADGCVLCVGVLEVKFVDSVNVWMLDSLVFCIVQVL